MAIDFSDLGGVAVQEPPTNSGGNSGGIDFSDLGGVRVNGGPTVSKILPKMIGEAARDVVLRMGRPALEYGGLMAGGSAGAPLGIGGSTAGAGLGYAGGKQIGNILGRTLGDEPTPPLTEQFKSVAEDVGTGAKAELMGQGAGALGKAAEPVIGPYIAPFLGRLKKGFQKVGEALTGKSAEKVGRLIEDPSVILPEFLGGAKSVPEASADYGKALGQSELTKPSFDPFSGDAKAKEMGSLTWQRWKTGFGEPIGPQEAYDAIQATKYAMPAALTERNAEKVRELMQFKDAMENTLAQQNGPFLEASKNYGRAKLKEDFSQWLPRTATNKISQVKSGILPLFTDAAKLKFLLATSPKIFGAATAGGVGLSGLTSDLLAQPGVRSMIMAYMSNPMPKPGALLGQEPNQ